MSTNILERYISISCLIVCGLFYCMVIDAMLRSSIMFASNRVWIADAWGTTNLPLEVPLPGSLLLVAGDQPHSHM
jgi:hypothetical protein